MPIKFLDEETAQTPLVSDPSPEQPAENKSRIRFLDETPQEAQLMVV